MFTIVKNFFLVLILVTNSDKLISETDPYIFIDKNAQLMVSVLIQNKDLFEINRDLYEDKIKEIFEPMIDFRRISASVMGKKYYLMATKKQRENFVGVFKNSLLDTYAETLAQWEDQSITTVFSDDIYTSKKIIEVRQTLDTGSSLYPIVYKLRQDNDSWKIVNIIINGVNLGLTFRNQFQALAEKSNNDLNIIIQDWVSDAGEEIYIENS
jgi:phospholipid transport system substrate-binding protein